MPPSEDTHPDGGMASLQMALSPSSRLATPPAETPPTHPMGEWLLKTAPGPSPRPAPPPKGTPALIRDKEAVMMPQDEDKPEAEVSYAKVSDTSAGSLDCKILQELLIIENVSPLPDSGSEICEIDSDSDRGIGLEYDLEQQWKDSDSVMWELDSDSEMCPMGSDSVQHLPEGERYPMASDSVKDLMESEQHLVEVEQFQVDNDSLKYWGDSDSEKCFVDSDNEKPDIDSDSEKCPMASASLKHLLKAEKFQMASDSIKRMMDSEKRLMDIRQHCMVSDSEEYEMDSGMEKDKIASASASGVHLMGKEKCQEKPRSKRYRKDSDTEPCGLESDLERHVLATTAAEVLVGTKTHQLSTDTERRRMDFLSERHTMDLDSESLGRTSDSGKHKMKAKSCQSKAELERSWVDHRSDSEKSLIDSERQQLDFDYDRRKDSSRRYQHKSARFQDSSERCQVDFEKHWDNFERHQRDSDSKKHPASPENKKSNELESERHMIEREKEPCMIPFESKRLRLDEEQGNYDMDSDSVKEQQITPDHERHHLDSENEAQRLGARKKGNRPPGFWRPVFLSPSFVPAKKTEEKHSMQQTGSKVSKIQHVRQPSDGKSVRCKEVSPTPSNKEDSQQKFKEEDSQNLSPDPNTSGDTKHNTMHHHGTPGPDNIINISNVVGLESEGQFNLTSSQFENESNTYETKLVSADNLNNGAKDKPFLKDERDDETDSENPEDENNTKDKTGSDNSDPKDRNAENDTDTNNGSDSSGDADPTSGADSNSDGDSNNGIDSSTNPDSTIDKDTNNNANSNYTDSEKKYTINSDNASGLDNDVDQDCIAGLNNGTNLKDTSVLQHGTDMDYTSSYKDGASLSNPTKSGNGICSNNGTDTTNEAGPNNNRPDPNLNGSSLQNNGPGRQNNRRVPTSLASITMDLISTSMVFTQTTALPSTIIALSLKKTQILIIKPGLVMPLVSIVHLVLTRMLMPTLTQNPPVLLVATIQLSQTITQTFTTFQDFPIH
ncbi:hypothetical protein MDA_GLEAN10005887 [Myotis davidii]|uniref:Uncharacterized protein n=1 Tax=Myotis davidii TaxID=225400 RepID=L5ME88_MYODS|nr:hypothetical protein MDA_GLEAN10005887 [Myotis davidii]